MVELRVPLGNIPKAMFYPLGKLALRRLYRKAVKLYGRPDLLHAHFTDYAYLASLLADEEKLPLVVTEHSSLVNRQLLPADIEKPAKAAYRRADCLIAVSPALAVRMQQHSGRKVEWVPDMVDTNLFAYSDSRERQRAWMEETQTEEEGCSFTFLSCGNLRKVKRMDLLIRAFAQAFRESPQVSLTICGQGEEEGALRRLIAELGMEQRIELAGLRPREEIAKRLAQTDCFVLASESETFGVSYLAALSCGVPVIATRCGGPECFVNEHNGIMVETGNVDALARAMLTIYCNIDFYNRPAIAQEVRRVYSSQAVARSLIRQYENLLDSRETQLEKEAVCR